MAELFNRASVQNIGLTYQDIYQAPNVADTNRSALISIYCCNKAITATDITLAITNSSNTIQALLASTITIPVDGSWEAVANRVVLLRGEKIRALASATNAIDITISCVEVV